MFNLKDERQGLICVDLDNFKLKHVAKVTLFSGGEGLQETLGRVVPLSPSRHASALRRDQGIPSRAL